MIPLLNNLAHKYHHYPTTNFSTIKKEFLYKGGVIEDAAEFNYVVWHKGARSILSFLDPNKHPERNHLSSELRHINRHNQNYPELEVTFDCLPCWSSELRSNAKKFKELLIEKINSLPKPIYMHCLLGRHLSEEAELQVIDAIKKGQIKV